MVLVNKKDPLYQKMAKIHDEFMKALTTATIKAIASGTVPVSFDEIYRYVTGPEAPAVIKEHLIRGGSLHATLNVVITQLIAQGRIVTVDRRGVGRLYDLTPLDRLAAQG